MSEPTILPRMAKGGPEQRAIEAGEVDAFIDYSSNNVILLPAARQALRKAAGQASAALRSPADRIPVANRILAGLPETEYRRLLAGSDKIVLRPEELLHDQGARIRHVYFPIDSTIALLSAVENDLALEVGLVGYEGMVGISPLFGVLLSSVRTVVRSPGEALRLDTEWFQRQLGQSRMLRAKLHRYAFAALTRARLDIACNVFHTVPARLARRLLMVSDRALSPEFFLTQVMLAAMLGVRRATVNEAAGPLQRGNLIRYTRGTITILDRKGLEGVACRCYTRLPPPPRGIASR